MSKLEKAILTILRGRRGIHQAIPRKLLKWNLQTMGLKVSDRQMRMAIENLRRTSDEGALICSTSGRSGYWFATTENELLNSYREERRRALSILITIRERKERGRRALAHILQGRMF